MHARRRLRILGAACLGLLLLAPASACAGGAQHGDPVRHGDRDDRATTLHRFEDPERWARVLDDPERDAWQKPEEVVRALALRPGDVVADVGAGTGYFNAHWSRAVGEEGVVFAVELEPNLLAHMRDRAEREGTANVTPVLASRDDPRLPPRAVDLAILVDTYHHLDRRRDYFRRLRRSLAPGGRLVVLDWRKDAEIPVGPPPEHRLRAERVVAELEEAGYTQAGRLDFLPYQYGLVFRVGSTGP